MKIEKDYDIARTLEKKEDFDTTAFANCENYCWAVWIEETAEFFGERGEFFVLVFDFLLNARKTDAATITTATGTMIMIGRLLDDVSEGEDVDEVPKA